MTDPNDVDDAERAAQSADDSAGFSLPLEAEPADAIEQSREVPQDDDDYREG